MGNLGGVLNLIILIFIIFLAVCWIILPFLVAGINSRLDKLIRLMQQRRMSDE